MTGFTLDTQTLQTIALFEHSSGAQVRDCIITEDQVIFIVEAGEIGKAVGKGGHNVRSLEHKLKKRVKVVEYNPDLSQFVKNVVAPLELNELALDDATVIMSAKDLKTRGLLIGRSASNLRLFESIVKRYFPVKELRVA